MPTAKSDQVITHRIELQQTERKLLEKYIDQQNDGLDDPKLAVLKILSNGSTGFFIASGVVVAAPLVVYTAYWWKIRLEAAMAALDPAQALDDLKEEYISPLTSSAKEGFNDSLLGQAFEGAEVIWGWITG